MNVSPSPAKSRLIICDPVCVFPYGHNVPLVANFRNYLQPHFDDVISIGCRLLPKSLSEENKIDRCFEYLYNDVMPLPDYAGNVEYPEKFSEKTDIAKRNIITLIDTYHVSSTDVLCFPSVDFYTLHALAEAADVIIAAGRPKILLRLIGVMEHAPATLFQKPQNVLFAIIRQLRNAGLDIRLAAETPRYAEFLAMNLDCTVSVCANIELRPQQPFKSANSFNVICPGSARYDKGFLDLLEIFTTVRNRDRGLRIRFQTQVLPDRDLKHQQSYLSRLYSVPGVTLLPSQISAGEMEAMYDGADLVLLPYAKDVYGLRGSAVLVEAICAGRQVVALDGAAFTDQIRYFGAGEICTSLAEMADAIVALSRLSPVVRHAKARQARERFINDLANSYQQWMA